jgi:Mrp family chromosome partitioning ATPase
MESTDYLRVLRRRWLVIVGAGILGFLAVWFLGPSSATDSRTGSYTATATIAQAPDLPRNVHFTALLVTTGPVPAAAAERLDYAGAPVALARSVTAKADPETGAVTISAIASDPERAKLVADTFAEETVAEMARRLGGDQRGIEFLQPAVAVPTETGVLAGPTTQGGRLLLGVVVGLILGGALALLVERFDTTVRDRLDVQRAYRVPVLAEIPRLPRSWRGPQVVVRTEPTSMAAETFRSLRSSVLLMPSRVLRPADADVVAADLGEERARPKLIMVTSARSGEGKTTVTANLAAALAEGGHRVLVLDCDFRRPDVHRFLDVPDGPGLSDLIHAGEGAEQLLALSRPTAVDGVRLVTAGTLVDQSPALPMHIAGLLAESRELADIVIVDSSPMLLGNDAMDLMPYVDTVLVTCRSGRLTRERADRAGELLARMRVPVVGAALNGSRAGSPPLKQLMPHRASGTGSSERRRGPVESAARGQER